MGIVFSLCIRGLSGKIFSFLGVREQSVSVSNGRWCFAAWSSTGDQELNGERKKLKEKRRFRELKATPSDFSI